MKFLTVEEFSDWAAKHSSAEVEQAAIEQQAMLRGELLESAGVSLEQYQEAPRDGRAMTEQAGGEVWIHEDQQREASEIAGDSTEQDAVLREFCDRHPQHFPSQSNGDLFATEYATAFQEANPGVPVFWELNAMEVLYSGMVAAGAFEVERVYKS